MAIQPRDVLDKGARISVEVASGAPSAEGPLLSSSPQSFQFSVHEALASTRSLCGWRYNRQCRPTDWWRIEFNNPLDAAAFDPSWVTIEPALERPHVVVSGNAVRIGGQKVGNTTYTVTIPKELQDTFGQTLGADEDHSFKVGPAEPDSKDLGNSLYIEPAGSQTFHLHYQPVRGAVESVRYARGSKDIGGADAVLEIPRQELPTMPGTELVDRTTHRQSSRRACGNQN